MNNDQTQPNLAIPQVTGVRIFLCLVVIISNFMIYYDMDPGFFRKIKFNYQTLKLGAAIAVDIFFMMTGLLLYHHYKGIFRMNIGLKNIRDFMVTRIARIYPVYALSLISILFLNHLGIWGHTDALKFSAARIDIDYSWFYNFGLATMWTSQDFKVAWNGPAWSISAEFFNYLLLPLILLSIGKLMKGWMPLISLIFLLIYYGFIQHFYIQSFSADFGFKTIIRANFGVMAGIFICGLYYKLKPHVIFDHAFVLSVFSILALLTVHYLDLFKFPLIILWALSVIFMLTLTMASGFIKTFLSSKVLVELGKICFAIYTFHQLVSRTLGYLFYEQYSSVAAGDLKTVLIYTFDVTSVCILVGALVFYSFENPLRYSGRYLLGVRRKRLNL
jgi:peptidoglycan/LPS O-acetylase OafA/YrhL